MPAQFVRHFYNIGQGVEKDETKCVQRFLLWLALDSLCASFGCRLSVVIGVRFSVGFLLIRLISRYRVRPSQFGVPLVSGYFVQCLFFVHHIME